MDAQETEIYQAAKIAQIKHLINQSNLSAIPVSRGKKQRITISRAIIRSQNIYV